MPCIWRRCHISLDEGARNVSPMSMLVSPCSLPLPTTLGRPSIATWSIVKAKVSSVMRDLDSSDDGRRATTTTMGHVICCRNTVSHFPWRWFKEKSLKKGKWPKRTCIESGNENSSTAQMPLQFCTLYRVLQAPRYQIDRPKTATKRHKTLCGRKLKADGARGGETPSFCPFHCPSRLSYRRSVDCSVMSGVSPTPTPKMTKSGPRE